MGKAFSVVIRPHRCVVVPGAGQETGHECGGPGAGLGRCGPVAPPTPWLPWPGTRPACGTGLRGPARSQPPPGSGDFWLAHLSRQRGSHGLRTSRTHCSCKHSLSPVPPPPPGCDGGRAEHSRSEQGHVRAHRGAWEGGWAGTGSCPWEPPAWPPHEAATDASHHAASLLLAREGSVHQDGEPKPCRVRGCRKPALVRTSICRSKNRKQLQPAIAAGSSPRWGRQRGDRGARPGTAALPWVPPEQGEARLGRARGHRWGAGQTQEGTPAPRRFQQPAPGRQCTESSPVPLREQRRCQEGTFLPGAPLSCRGHAGSPRAGCAGRADAVQAAAPCRPG